ncbi:putative 2-oxoglutarate (2OG) and Fe(II)-dependent oxygenase superfamily protein [Hibiscus syriacus]|uniref:2-oxoglutarate (2OG) and Fe(II)-dependent oxygenase superfamily protein n=1 Tax=Hibiscus syriacus TaxID=106335 RepID=A0A6A2X3Q8_HIBSY|nr:probable 2-oxoglutarate-dependent dioxygenase AOP1 [Hibiscus syriacus]KAE8669411.1 putative 2-oxoglutarate (2OG) and Fe(II)-dependent oxygenase superfamily protein [Hibiscus syriacus]
MAKIPVIDFSKLDLIKPGSLEWDWVKSQVMGALEAYNCFEASVDRAVEHREPVFRAMEEFFHLPLETKRLCESEKPLRGYFGPPPLGLHESLSIDDAHVAENLEPLTTTLWPQGNTSFSKTMVSFIQLVSELEKTIMRMILESFGVEKYTDELIDSTNYQLRALKYEGPNTNEPVVMSVPHHDLNMITLLYQNEINGLGIQTEAGEWIDVKPSPNSIIVIIGESLSVWLNGRLSPTRHRVVTTGNRVRHVVGLFARTRGGYLVKAPSELVDDENPRLFKPYDHEDFIEHFSTQLDQGNRTNLITYCSI